MGTLTPLPRRKGADHPGAPAAPTATQVELFLVRLHDGHLLVASTNEFEAHARHRSVGGARSGAYIDRVHVWVPDSSTPDEPAGLTS